jgi:hypothetical protein
MRREKPDIDKINKTYSIKLSDANSNVKRCNAENVDDIMIIRENIKNEW